MARISTMHHLTIPYGKIQKLIQMFHGRDIVVSALEDLDWRVATCMEPLYYGLLDEITDAKIAGGDDTGWYINGKNCWVWVFHSVTCTIYHISLSRSKHVSDAFLLILDNASYHKSDTVTKFVKATRTGSGWCSCPPTPRNSTR